jgi:orotidine-5'-phosphate decarboxylase
MELLQARWDEGKFVCVGLDSDVQKLPDSIAAVRDTQFAFNQRIIDATSDLVCCYKPNLAFYGSFLGFEMLRQTIKYIIDTTDVPVILDAKQADIGSTNDGYVLEDFGFFGADAVTVHPYLGMEAMKPFLDQNDKGIIVLVRTSNPGAGEFQDLRITEVGDPDKLYDYEDHVVPLYQIVARHVAHGWNYNGNCAVVVGATYPAELAEVRKIVGDMPILIPGIGAQGGELEATVKAGANSRGQGMIINSSRGIIFASAGEDFAEAARAATQKMHDDITAVLAAA